MTPTMLIFVFCLGFTLSRGFKEEDTTATKALLRKALSEIGELKKDNALLKQAVREITLLKRKTRSYEMEKIGNLSPEGLVAPSNRVAFSAYMSFNIPAPSVNQTLIFDVIKLNLGNGYNKNTGIFNVPEDGIYAFSYGITCGTKGVLFFQLKKNGESLIDKRCDNGESNDYKEVSGTIIAQLTSNNVVYISTKKAATTNIISYPDNLSFLSGWKIN